MGVSDVEVVQQNQCFPVSCHTVPHGRKQQEREDIVAHNSSVSSGLYFALFPVPRDRSGPVRLHVYYQRRHFDTEVDVSVNSRQNVDPEDQPITGENMAR